MLIAHTLASRECRALGCIRRGTLKLVTGAEREALMCALIKSEVMADEVLARRFQSGNVPQDPTGIGIPFVKRLRNRTRCRRHCGTIT